MSLNHRTYVVGLFTAILLFMATVFSFGAYIEPFHGDLTRMGGFSERDFGWTRPQQGFQRRLYDLGRYDRYFDVVVIGDSFSFNTHPYQWQNFLANETGATMVTLDLRRVEPRQILDNPVFQASPPRLVVFAQVERYLLRSFGGSGQHSCDQGDNDTIDTSFRFLPKGESTHSLQRNYKPSEYFSFGFPFAYLYRAVRRAMTDPARWSVREVPLSRPNLFSNTQPDKLLFYFDEVKDKPWTQQQIQTVRCELLQLQMAVQKNGRTRFIAMLVPDRLTAYSKYLVNQELAQLSRLDQVFGAPLNAPRIDDALRNAISHDGVDVYLPDDTHWGWTAHRLAADAIIETIASTPHPD